MRHTVLRWPFVSDKLWLQCYIWWWPRYRWPWGIPMLHRWVFGFVGSLDWCLGHHWVCPNSLDYLFRCSNRCLLWNLGNLYPVYDWTSAFTFRSLISAITTISKTDLKITERLIAVSGFIEWCASHHRYRDPCRRPWTATEDHVLPRKLRQ